MKKTETLRTCLVTGEELPKEQLLRFVASPEGRVVVDVKGNLPGRGMWLKPERRLVEEACRRNLFSRSAKAKLRVDADLSEKVAEALRTRALGYLNRARLAREMVSGHEKVLSILQSGEAGVLIHAENASVDGCKKLDKCTENIEIISFGTRDELAAALNLPNPVHLALQRGGLAEAFLAAYRAWAGYASVIKS